MNESDLPRERFFLFCILVRNADDGLSHRSHKLLENLTKGCTSIQMMKAELIVWPALTQLVNGPESSIR